MYSKKFVCSSVMILAAGVTAGLVVGGSTGLPWGPAPGAAQAVDRAKPAEPAPAVDADAALTAGPVALNQDVEKAANVERGRTHTRNGAAAAFSAYAVWVIGSPAAREDPTLAPEVIGGNALNPADAALLSGMRRGADDSFDAASGAYRIIGHSGDEDHPDQVMVEVAAPLTLNGSSRWAVIGGVVKWTDAGWETSSIQPREIQQPSNDASAADLTEKDRAKTLAGLGWQLFTDPE